MGNTRVLIFLVIGIFAFVSISFAVSAGSQCDQFCGIGPSCFLGWCPGGLVRIGEVDCGALRACCCPNRCADSSDHPLSGTNYVCQAGQDGKVGGCFDCLVNGVSTGSRCCSADQKDICKGSKLGGWPCQAAQAQCGSQGQPCCSSGQACTGNLICQGGTCQPSTGGQITCTCDNPNQPAPNNHYSCSDSSKNAWCESNKVCSSSSTWTWPNYPCTVQVTCTCDSPNNANNNHYTCPSDTTKSGNCGSGTVCSSSSTWTWPNVPCTPSASWNHYLRITVTDGSNSITMDKPDYMGGQRCSPNTLQVNSQDQVTVNWVLYKKDGTQETGSPVINLDVGNCGAAGGGGFTTVTGATGSHTFSQSELSNIFSSMVGSSLFLNYKDPSGNTLGTSAEVFLQLPSVSTPTGCSNPYPSSSGTDTYGVRLCRSDYNSCSWSGTDNVQVGAADSNGNIQVTFTSQSAFAVNVWTTNGRIVHINSNYVGAYGYATAEVCDQINTADQCNPSTLVKNSNANYDFASNLQHGFIGSSSNINDVSLGNPVRSLNPLYFVNGQASMTIVPTCIVQGGDCTDAPNIILYYQLYYDTGTNAGVSSWCDTTAGNLCSAQHASYTGCTGNLQNVAGQPDSIQTNSELCIRSGSGAVVGNACWHYPWEIYPNLWTPLSISSQGATTSTTTSTSSTSTTSIPPVSTSSTSSTTSTSSTSTTTTTPTIQSLAISCSPCYANSACNCSIPSNSCNNGGWFVKNLNGNPLPVSNVSTIPPYSVYFFPNQTGTVNVTASCMDAFPNNRTNSTTVTVQNPFLVCPPTCTVNTACTCTVNNCNSGLFLALFNNTAISVQTFSANPYTAAFTPTQIGNVTVVATCNNPLLPSVTASISIIGNVTTTTTTSTPPVQGSFTHSNFKCLRGTDNTKWTCSISYSNQVGQPAFVFFDLFNVAGKRLDSKSVTASPTTVGSAVAAQIFDCSIEGLGTYSVTFKVYQTETRVSPIDWSNSLETQTVSCI